MAAVASTRARCGACVRSGPSPRLGEWDTMRACFHPDATVHVSWFRDRSRHSSSAPSPCRPHAGRRSAASTGSAIRASPQRRPRHPRDRHAGAGPRLASTGTCSIFDDIRCACTTASSGAAARGASLRMVVIYDKDRLDPVVPGSVPASFFDGIDLNGAQCRHRLHALSPDAKKGRTCRPISSSAAATAKRRVRAETEPGSPAADPTNRNREE